MEKRDDGEGHADDEAHAVVVGPAGDAAFVTGSSTGTTTGVDFKTIAYAA